MFGLIAPLLCAIAGICALTAVQYFLLARSPQRRGALLFFALLSLSIAGFELATLFTYRADSAAAYVTATRWLADFGCLGGVFTLWFAANYSDAKSRRWPWVLSALYATLILINHVLPAGVILQPGGTLTPFMLPWGESIERVRGVFNPWGYLYYGSYILVAFYCLAAGQRVRRAGRKRRGLALGVGATLMAAAFASDILMEQQVWETLYLSDYAFLPLVFMMNVALVTDFVTSTERLRRLGEAAFEGIFVTREARIVDANEQLLAMLGYSRSAITGYNAYDLIVPEQRAAVAAWIGGNSGGVMESMALRADGSRFPIEFSPRLIASDGPRTFITVVRDITERKAAMAALQASERKYSILFHSSPDAVLLTRLDVGLILEVNAQFTRLFGYARDEAIGRTTLELGLWSDPADRIHLIQRLKSEGSLRDIERNTYHRDGTVRTVLISFEPIELDGAECVIAILHDITERKLAELALRASEERFELAVRGTSDGLWDWDIVTNSVYYSPRFGELLGYPPGQMPQRREVYFERIHPDDLPRVHAALRAHMENHTHYDVSYRVCCLDGKYRWFRSRAEAVRAVDGKPLRMVGSLSDIHDHRLAEEALRRSEAEFRAIFEGSAIGIALIDTDNTILMCNPALCQFLGYSGAELCARPYGEKTHPDDQGRDQALYRELLAGRRDFLQDEKRYVHKDGHIVWGRRTVSVVRHEDGSVRCAIGMVEDISSRKTAEESLRLAHEREARAHAEFTRRLLVAQEQERKRLATELHDSLGQHLSLIKNRASLSLEQPAVPSEAVRHLESILDVITAAIGEVRNLALQLRPLHIEKFGLTSSLESLLEQLADSGAVQVTHRIENVDDVLHGDDATHVYRITQEALNNLLRHAQATRAKVTLVRDLSCVRLSIEDDGRGFDFGAGTNGGGLGLTSIRERVALLEGSVAILSAPGKGTRVQIELPISQS